MTKLDLRMVVEQAIDKACGNDGKNRLYPDDAYLAFAILNAIENSGMLIQYSVESDVISETVFESCFNKDQVEVMKYSYKRLKS